MKDFFNSKDKLQHMLLSAVIVVVFKVIAELVNPFGGVVNTAFAGLLTLVVGATKELVDYFTKTHVSSWKDFLADIIGLLSTMIPLMFI